MAITSSELVVINGNPIKNALGTVKRLFASTRADLGVTDLFNTVRIDFSAAPGMAQILVAYLPC